MTGFSTREVSEALGFPTSTILAWARGGLVTPLRGPRGAYVFSFQDLAVLKAARDLLGRELPTRRIREALERLREQMPAGRPLSAVRLEAMGRTVLVRDGGSLWDPTTGQFAMDLEVVPESEPPHADDLYDRAFEVEATDAGGAQVLYRQVLDRNPHHADAAVNLGRLLHESGAVDEAARWYAKAVSADPTHARAHFNLGVAFEDLGRIADAIDCYGSALDHDPELAVAHFNLSRLLESTGASAEALGHLSAYKRLLDRRVED